MHPNTLNALTKAAASVGATLYSIGAGYINFGTGRPTERFELFSSDRGWHRITLGDVAGAGSLGAAMAGAKAYKTPSAAVTALAR